MRADARDNRTRILGAAEEVFGRSPDASTDDVAKLAGVGIATVFRHFPTKVRTAGTGLREAFGNLLARAQHSGLPTKRGVW